MEYPQGWANRGECNVISLSGLKQFGVLLSVFLATSIANANPVLNNVAAGQVAITQTPGKTTVQQNSSKAIINWQSFNIQAGETTHFQQPANGIALNRISPVQGASQIFGSLTATGKIILINAAGVYFGPTARVDVGGIMVSTSNMTDKNFLAGRYIFDQPSTHRGAIVNEGSIKVANYGLAALMGNGVINNGVIEARMGNVVLASGNTFTVDMMGDRLLNFSIQQEATQTARDRHGNELKDGVANRGKLIADGGKILLTGRAAQGVVDNVVNISGYARAKSLRQVNGVIILDAGDGKASVSGKLIATSKKGNGGTVKVLAKNVHIKSTALVDVSGATGGGEILIGGNKQGLGPERNAKNTTVDRGALLKANATEQGNGGKIIVWSDDTTLFDGTALAQGGVAGGHGGFVETSGHSLWIGDHAFVSTRAPQGLSGTWLLDPIDLTISNDANSNVSGSSPFQSTGGNSNVNISTLLAALNAGNVVIQTTSGGSGGNGDIFVNTDIGASNTWNNSNSLTLTAYRNIVANANITNGGNGDIVLRADNTGTGIGTVSFASGKQASTGGNVNIYYNPTVFGTQDVIYTGGTTPVQYMLVNTATKLQNINANLNENYALSNNINAVGFSIPLGSTATPFTGKFDGQGYQISNLLVTGGTDVGLFGATSATASIRNVGISGKFNGTGATNVGSLVGSNAGTIANTYSYAAVDGTNATHVGGLVGENIGTGSITSSYSIGYVKGTGATQVGGLVGNNTSVGLITNNYWDTESSGQASSAIGTGQSTANLKASLLAGFSSSIWGLIPNISYPYLLAGNPTTPRVISGKIMMFNTSPSATNANVLIPQWPPVADPSATPGTTVNLIGQNADGSNILFDSTQTGNNGSYYFLESANAIADNTPLLTYLGDNGVANTVTKAPTRNLNGTLLESSGSITDLYLVKNTLLLADNGSSLNPTISYYVDINTPHPTAPYMVNFTPQKVTIISNTDLATVLNNFETATLASAVSNNQFLYTNNTSTSTDIDVKSNNDFVTAPKTRFDLTGDLATTDGDITFHGVVQENNLGRPFVKVSTNNSGNIVNNNTIIWKEGTVASPNSDTLYLDSAENIVINAPILGMWWTATGGSAAYNKAVIGSLRLSAAYNDKTQDPTIPSSITTGPSGTITVYNFFLDKGNWWQVVPQKTTYNINGTPTQVDTLPYFQLSYAGGPSAVNPSLPFNVPLYAFLTRNEFQIAQGALPSVQAEFIRAAAANPTAYLTLGTPSNPFLIEGIYGLQGIASGPYTLQAHYRQIQNIGAINDGSAPNFWNDGAGFVPIGDAPIGTGTRSSIPLSYSVDPEVTGFSGTYDGDGYQLTNISIFPDSDYVGLFGYTTSSAVIKNLPYFGLVVGGGNYVGNLVGYNQGTISNIALNAAYTEGNNYVGGILGYNSGSLIDTANLGGVVFGTDYVGGIVGYNTNLIDKTLSVTYTVGDAYVGGIAGFNSGVITHSFWDTDFSGLNQAVGDNAGTLDAQGGCFNGICKNGGTVNLSSAAPYQAAGWNFSSANWAILPGTISYVQTPKGLVPFSRNLSYPYLALKTGYFYHAPLPSGKYLTSIEFTNPIFQPAAGVPQVFAGYLTGLPLSDLAGQLVAGAFSSIGNTPNFIPNVSTLNYALAQSGANGFYYGYSPFGIIPDNANVTALILGNYTGTSTYRQPINGGSVVNLNFSVVPGKSTSSLAQFLTFTNSTDPTTYALGFLYSVINSTALYENIYTELNATSNLYNTNLANGGGLQQSNLFAACKDSSSEECQKLLAEYGDDESPAENITKLISREVSKDKAIKDNDEFIPAYCGI